MQTKFKTMVKLPKKYVETITIENHEPTNDNYIVQFKVNDLFTDTIPKIIRAIITKRTRNLLVTREDYAYLKKHCCI